MLRQNSVFSLVEEGDVLVSTVGPFVKYGEPAVRAAIAAPRHLPGLDGRAGVHPPRLRGVRRAGAAGTGRRCCRPWATTSSRASSPRRWRSRRPATTPSASTSATTRSAAARRAAGTKESLVGALLDDGFAFRGGRVSTERGAARVTAFDVKGRERPAVSIGSAEHFTLPAAYPQLREVNAYLGWFGPLSRAVQAGTLAGRSP